MAGDGFSRIESVLLFQHYYCYILMDPDSAGICCFLAAKNAEQGGFTGTIQRHQGDLVTFFDMERNIFKQGACAVGLCKPFYCNIMHAAKLVITPPDTKQLQIQ